MTAERSGIAPPAQVPDAAQRAAAIDPRRSYIVQAPAGSGKTTLLTQRYLALLAHAERPEEVLAITFTRKAAAEMRHRIVQVLERASRQEPARDANDARSLELARAALARGDAQQWGLLAHPTRLRVQTIDSLNQWLAHRLPVLSRAGASLAVQERAEDLHAVAAERVVAALESNEPLAARLAIVLMHLDNDASRLVDLLVTMLARRDHWLRLLAPGAHAARGPEVRAALERALQGFVTPALAAARRAIPAALAARLVPLCREAAKRRTDPAGDWACLHALDALPDTTPDAVPRWQRIAASLLTKEGEWRKSVTKTQGFPTTAPADKADFLQLIDELAALPGLRDTLLELDVLPPARYDDAQWQALDALIDVLVAAAAELALVFAERGQVDFPAVAGAALQALGTAEEPSEFALALDYQIKHVLVDEFQDTSQTQVRLLQQLTAGWTPGDGRTLFCVGDPMQSIYRFREADVALFLQIRARGLGSLPLESLVLEANFRSQPGIVDWVNDAFARVLPANDDLARGAVRYARSIAVRAPGVAPAVVCHALPRAEPSLEARELADLVAAERAADHGATIAVLARNRSHLSGLARELRAAGVPFQGIELVPLQDRLVVLDLVSLTRALSHLADRAAWLACLRAPWCGLELSALHALVGDRPHDVVLELLRDPQRRARLEKPAAERLARTLRVLEAALADRGRRPLAAVVEAAWVELGGPATASEAADLDNARAFLERLDGAERAGDLDEPAALEDLLGELYAAPDPDADERLQLMTIHKAKGLEWDVVIVPGLGRAPRADDDSLLRWLEFDDEQGGRGLVLAPLKARATSSDPLTAWLRRIDAQRAAHELGRLLYVAATRARRRLHLVGHLQPAASGEPGAFAHPNRRSALYALWPAIGADMLRDARARQAAAGDAADAAEPVPEPRLARLADDWRAPPPDLRLSPPAELVTGIAPGEVPFDWVTAAGRHAGTVVHEELERLARTGCDAAGFDARADLWRRRLRELGLPEAAMATTVERVRVALASLVADPRGRWLFDPAHREAASELALTAVLGSEVVVSVIDRTFVDAAGVRWIVDFKTSLQEGADLEGFLDRERDRYREQLERYAAVMRLREPTREIRLGLYFPLHAGWREWAPEGALRTSR